MEKQVLLDKLSEFLMVEQAGAQLYEVAASRAPDKQLRQQYEEFGQETREHREKLITLIERLGGDPDYVSPTARVAQVRGEQMLNLALVVNGLSEMEMACLDLESVVHAETKDHADWSLLQQMAQEMDEVEIRDAMQAIVDEVEAEEDEHVRWAKNTLMEMQLKMVMSGPAPSPERWEKMWAGPHYTVDQHPAPAKQGLMEGAEMPSWVPALTSRAVKAGK